MNVIKKDVLKAILVGIVFVIALLLIFYIQDRQDRKDDYDTDHIMIPLAKYDNRVFDDLTYNIWSVNQIELHINQEFWCLHTNGNSDVDRRISIAITNQSLRVALDSIFGKLRYTSWFEDAPHQAINIIHKSRYPCSEVIFTNRIKAFTIKNGNFLDAIQMAVNNVEKNKTKPSPMLKTDMLLDGVASSNTKEWEQAVANRPKGKIRVGKMTLREALNKLCSQNGYHWEGFYYNDGIKTNYLYLMLDAAPTRKLAPRK